MTKRILQLSLAAGAFALAVAAAAPLVAQDNAGQGPPGPPMGRMFRGPGGPGRGPGGPGPGALGELGPALHQAGITEDQQTQIKAIMDSHRDEFKAVGERMRTVHEGMRALIEADTLDENAIKTKSIEAAAVESDQIILGARVRGEVLALLTPEQLDKVKQVRAEMQKRRAQGPPLRRGQH